MIIHVPHASYIIDNMIEFTNDKRIENVSHLIDTDIDFLFSHEYHQMINFPYSRFVCDVERLPNDPLNKIGQGIIYTKDIFGDSIKRNIPDSKVYEMYGDHHRKLQKAVNHSLSLFNKVVIVDAHSFTDDGKGIDICIGTDNFHTPEKLLNIAVNFFINVGYTVGINVPFSGTIVPEFHTFNENVYSIMIELNKRIYKNRINNVRKMIGECLDKISEFENKE